MSDDDFEEKMKQFRRELLGPMCAHMTDEQIIDFLEPWAKLVSHEMPIPEELKKRWGLT